MSAIQEVYLVICILIAIGIFGSYVWEYFTKTPDTKFGYSITSSIGWWTLVFLSTPYLNLITFTFIVYLFFENAMGYKYRESFKNLHQVSIKIPSYGRTNNNWAYLGRLNRCVACGCLPNKASSDIAQVSMNDFGIFTIDINCHCCGTNITSETSLGDFGVAVDKWNSTNPVDISINSQLSELHLLDKLKLKFKLMFGKVPEVQSIDIFTVDELRAKGIIR